MTLDECIKQLKDLRRNQESFINKIEKVDENNPFVKDMQAINKALEVLEAFQARLNGGETE